MFADDTNLTTSDPSVADIETNLNEDLEHIHQWLLTNKPTVHQEKTEYIIDGSTQRLNNINIEPDLKLGGSRINSVKENNTGSDS